MTPGTSPVGSQPPGADEYDICILGAGAAGLVLAEILSRRPGVRLCLLEAGPERLRDRKEPFNVRSVLKQHTGVNEARVTVFGGATNTWGGGLIRLNPPDFEPMLGRSDTAWPLPYGELVRHYEAIESLFGFSAAPEGPDSLVIDRPDLCVRQREISVLPFRKKNFAHLFGPRLRARSNVTILCNAAVRCFHRAAAGEITHLDVEVAGSSPRKIAARKYVISAGLVNSVLLVQQLLAGRDDPAGPPAPGEYFHDHVSFAFARLHPRSHHRFSKRFGYRFERGLMIGEHFDIESKKERIPGAFLHLAFDTEESSILRPVRALLNMIQQRTFRPREILSPSQWGPMVLGLPRLGYMRFVHGRLYLDPGTKILATIDLEQIPMRQWRLERETPGPDCRLYWDVSEEDARFAARYIPVGMDILARLREVADFDVENLVPDPETRFADFHAHLREKANDTYHAAGGLRMSVAPDGLVDPDLRLRGVPNAHVLVSAVFPRVGTSNPTHTLLALGHRLAEHLTGARLT